MTRFLSLFLLAPDSKPVAHVQETKEAAFDYPNNRICMYVILDSSTILLVSSLLSLSANIFPGAATPLFLPHCLFESPSPTALSRPASFTIN
jgi:hypothetical protein